MYVHLADLAVRCQGFRCRTTAEDIVVTIGRHFSSCWFVPGFGQPSRQPSSHSLAPRYRVADLVCRIRLAWS